jgi:hypothetical protein
MPSVLTARILPFLVRHNVMVGEVIVNPVIDPAQSGRRCHCQSCGRIWELPNPFNQDETVETCQLEDGTILFSDESRGLGVNRETGETYPAGPE